MRSLTIALLLALCACQVGTLPPPAPIPPPDTEGTPCERLCARVDALHCAGDGQRADCVETCQVYELEAQDAPSLSWNPECGAVQVTCAAIERCRAGGSP